MKEGDQFEITSYEQLHPGRFMKCGHLEGKPRTLTVVSHIGEMMGMKRTKSGGQTPDIKGILSFSETDLQYPCQVTNQNLLKAVFGKDPGNVIGKQVTLYPSTDKFGGRIVDCIRFAGSPSVMEDFSHVVEYSKQSGRPPAKFTIRHTEYGGEWMLPQGLWREGFAPIDPVDVDKWLKQIEAAGPESIDGLAKGAGGVSWSSEDKRRIGDAFKSRREALK